jgi:hypothetical protein
VEVADDGHGGAGSADGCCERRLEGVWMGRTNFRARHKYKAARATRTVVPVPSAAIATIMCWGVVVCSSLPAAGAPQAPSPDAAECPDVEQEEPEYNGQDYTRPQTSFETRVQYRESSGTTSLTDREILLLRLTGKFDLGAGWKLGVLAQADLVDKATRSFDPSSFDNEAGVGDSTFQAALIHSIDPNWAFGFGARLVSPTAQDSLGTGRWQVMPGFGIRYSFLDVGPDTYFVPVVRYAISFAGDPTRRNISEPQIAPTLNIGLPERWFFTFYPSNDIRINYGDPISGQTGRLFLPLDVAAGRKITDTLTASLEVGVPIIKDYPVYNFKTELKIAAQF